MKKVAVLFAEGYEEIEALSPVDVLRRANIDVTLVGMDGKKVKSSHNVIIEMDQEFDETIYQYDMVVLPGGMPGAKHLKEDKRVIDLIQTFDKENKWIGAICAAPIVLQEAGVIKDKIVTCYPGFETELVDARYQEALIQRDGNIITAKGPGAALAFGYELLKVLGGNDESLQEAMQYRYLMKK